MDELTPQQKQKLIDELTKYAKEGASDEDMRIFKQTMVSQFEQQNAVTLKKKEPAVSSQDLEGAGVGLSGGIKGISPSSSPLKSTSEGGLDKEGMASYLKSLGNTVTANVLMDSEKFRTMEQASRNISKQRPLLQINPDGSKAITRDESIANTAKKQADDRVKKIQEVQSAIYDGSATKEDVVGLYDFDEARPFLQSYLNSYSDKDKLPAAGDILTPGEHWDSAWKNSSHENRGIAVTKIDANVKQADEIISGLAGGKINIFKSLNGSMGMFDGPGSTDEIDIPSLDTNNPYQIGELIKKISQSNFFVDAAGNNISDKRDDVLSALQYKLDNIKRTEKIAPEIEALNKKIYYAIGDIENSYNEVTSSDPTVRQANTDERKATAFKRGLNYLRATDLATYSNVIRALSDKGEIAESDYQNILYKGQQLENFNTFIGGANNKELVGAETNFNLETRGSKVAKTSGILGETAKKYGLINKTEFSDTDIDYLVKNTDWEANGMKAPTEKEVDLIKAKEDQWFYDQIPKSGFTAALARGVQQPFLAIARTIEDKTSGSFSTDYLRSKELDRATGGEQLTPNKKGEYGKGLASDRGNLWYSVLEGAGAFIPQILLTRGLGSPFGAMAQSAAAIVPRAALTAEQLFAVNTATGTLLSSYLQSYGDNYEQALQKTGDPAKAQAMGNIGGIIDGVMEQWLPETKIGRNIARNLKGDVTEKIAAIVRKGGDPADVLNATKGLLRPFVSEYLNVTGQEMAEEGTAVLLKQLAETIISPQTAASNDVMHELGQTLWSTALQTFIPAVGSGGAASKNRFTQKVFNEAAIKYDYSADVLKKSLLKGTINQDEYNKSISLLSTHRNSIVDAPKIDENGDNIDKAKRNEFAYQETRIKINRDKAAKETGVQKELTEKKIKESEDIQRSILMPEKPATPEVKQEEAAANPEQDLFIRVQGSGNEGVKKLYDAPEKLVELYGQALTAPNSVNENLGGNTELTTDLIAKNTAEEIRASLADWTGKMKESEQGSLEFNDAESHVALLEQGLEKSKATPEVNGVLANDYIGNIPIDKLPEYVRFSVEWAKDELVKVKNGDSKTDIEYINSLLSDPLSHYEKLVELKKRNVENWKDSDRPDMIEYTKKELAETEKIVEQLQSLSPTQSKVAPTTQSGPVVGKGPAIVMPSDNQAPNIVPILGEFEASQPSTKAAVSMPSDNQAPNIIPLVKQGEGGPIRSNSDIDKVIEDAALLTPSQRRVPRAINDTVTGKQKMSAKELRDRASKLQDLIVNCLL